MEFWNYLGLAIVAKYIFGKKEHTDYYDQYKYDHENTCDPDMYIDTDNTDELYARMENLSKRMDQLENRINKKNLSFKEYDQLRDELEDLRDDYDDLESDL